MWRPAQLVLIAGIVGFGSTAALVAQAAPPPTDQRAADSERAVTLYRQSTRAYEEGRFRDAVNLLVEAYSLQQEPVILFDLAKAYEGLGDLDKAIDSYERYLARQPDASDRGSIEQRIATLRKQIDDRALLEKQRDEERVRAEEARRAAAEAQRRAALEQERRSRGVGAWPWVVATTGVVGVGAGVVFGAVSHGKYESAVNDAYRDPAQSDYSAARTYATAANVAFVAGGVVAAVGITWLLIDRLTTRNEVRAQRRVDRVGLTVSGLLVRF